MPSKITLKVIKGPLAGKKYAFAERTTCLIGRGLECYPRLPDDEFHDTISRNHCLLDINPPDIRIRDLGSLNGTFVNGKKIGQRAMGTPAEKPEFSEFPEFDLKDQDEITLGGTVFRLLVEETPVCVECGEPIPAGALEAARVGDGIFVCQKHSYFKGKRAAKEAPITTRYNMKQERKCARCGKSVSGEINSVRQGEYVCATCRNDPMKIARDLVQKANAGDEALIPVHGYKIIRELGRGGMGAVYLASNDETGEVVALKMMLPSVAADETARREFLREVEIMKSLSHPNIVSLKDFGYSNGVFFFTIDYCDGGSVERMYIDRGGLPLGETLSIALQALDGLDYAHNAEVAVKTQDGSRAVSKGVIHRDIKPANIFLAGEGKNMVAKVADLGMGKAFDMAGLSGHTMTGSSGGTPVFISRQQVINFKYAKPDIDVWSMAATLYWMLTGKFPRDFPKGKDPWQVVLQTQAVPIRERNGAIPAGLAEVIDKALIDKPEIQFKTAKELKAALLKVI